ncbi:MAG: hypothetical protein M3Y75_01940, partial [Actinomycetota bacterium]|nr:hypothetical protein [Actinomycetota bacterium]
MARTRPTPTAILIMVGALILTIAVGIWHAPKCDWDIAFFAVLLAFSIFSDLTAVSTESKLKISGSFLALVIAMVFLGGAPAALIGVATILTGWLRWRDEWHYLLDNVLTYAFFPLIGGLVFHEGVVALGLTPSDPEFYLCVFGLFQLALAINFVMIASYGCYVERSSFSTKLRVLPPVLPSEFASAMLAVAVAYIYAEIGIASIALFGVVLVTFQYLLGQLLLSQQRARELELRSKQLASFQVGMLSAMLRTLDLRDQMTARHSAAVARYSRAIAQRAGYSRREEEL